MSDRRCDPCRDDPHWFRCWLREERRTWGWVLLVIGAGLLLKNCF